jgi:hypothetical protein
MTKRHSHRGDTYEAIIMGGGGGGLKMEEI